MLGQKHIKLRFGDLKTGDTFWVWSYSGQEVEYWKTDLNTAETVYGQRKEFDEEEIVNINV